MTSPATPPSESVIAPADARRLIQAQREIAYASEEEIERLTALLGGVCIEDDLHVHKMFCLTCGWDPRPKCPNCWRGLGADEDHFIDAERLGVAWRCRQRRCSRCDRDVDSRRFGAHSAGLSDRTLEHDPECPKRPAHSAPAPTGLGASGATSNDTPGSVEGAS